MKEEDPLAELRRLRDDLGKRFKGSAKELGDYYRRISPLPGQEMCELESKAKAGKTLKTPSTKRRQRPTKVK